MMAVLLVGSLLLYACCSALVSADQAQVDYLAANLDVRYTVVNNFLETGAGDPVNSLEVTLTNTGPDDSPGTDWEIYFCSVRIWEPESLRPNPDQGVHLGNSAVLVYHVNGCLHKLAPDVTFPGFAAGVSVVLPALAHAWTVSRTDVSPNWYVTAPGAEPKTLESTAGESLAFVDAFDTPQQWKRRQYDEYNPYSAQDRYSLCADTADSSASPMPVIPSPSQYRRHSEDSLDISVFGWVVVSTSDDTAAAAALLADKLGMTVETSRPDDKYIEVTVGEVLDLNDQPVDNPEAYRLYVNVSGSYVSVVCAGRGAALFGAQTVLSLAAPAGGSLPDVTIVDWPRFPYRGFMADVSRHFLPLPDVLRLLDVMAMYKINRFHFHLSDDEGWRLEIPGLPELTEVGGRRCHDLDETSCLIPQLGSGPDADADNGSGFYTRDEYRQILQYAHDRGIEVIPEFDSPGHGHAPIKAMEARGDATYFLHDPEDTSKYTSIQEFRDNAINPCMESTYVFFEKVVQEVKAMHEDIQPLKIFHFGGDETPHGAWEGSPACEGFNIDLDGLKAYFASRLSNITSANGLDLAGWEDGLMSEGNEPYPRDSFVNDQVYGYAWNNIWEWGGGSRAYVLANNGYKVILSHATDLYFDHPYEPDPEERGFYWATRLTETRNTFNYMPDDVYENIEVDLFGRSITRDEICANPENCVPLEPGSESNIVGMAGQLWAETVRHPEQFNYMVFPRLVALAERAWHRAEWEALSDPDMRKAARDANWAQFAKTLGEKELVRLDAAGVQYRVPPPGARLSGGLLEACSSVPGLTIQYSEDSGESWTNWTAPGVEVTEDVLLRTQSADGNRFSHIVKLDSERTANTDATCTTSSAATCTLSLALLMLVVCFSFVCF